MEKDLQNFNFRDPQTKEKASFTIHKLILALSVVFSFLIASFGLFFYFQFSQVQSNSEVIVKSLVPNIIHTQRSFVNIDNLRNLLNSIHETRDQKQARDNFVNARAFLAELDLEDHFLPQHIREIDTQLVEFWDKRTHLVKLNELLIGECLGYASALNLIDHETNPDTPVSLTAELNRMIFEVLVTVSNLDLRRMRILHAVGNEYDDKCAIGASERTIDYCLELKKYESMIFATIKQYEELSQEFNLAYENLRNSVDGLVIFATQAETKSLSDRLITISEAAGKSKPLLIIWLCGTLLMFVIWYMLLVRLVSRPLRNIYSIIKIFREKRRRPKHFPKSALMEIQAINSMLPKLFEDVSEQAKLLKNQNKSYQQLLNISYKDELTGVKNRRALDTLISELKAVPAQVAILMIDIDNFKAFNDEKGHQYGDFVLSTIGRQLRASATDHDNVYRYGGEEFLLILQNVNAEEAYREADHLREIIRSLNIENSANTSGYLTISVGLSLLTKKENEYTMQELIAQADKGLYQAKGAGRNIVIRYTEELNKPA
ncbi:MAG: GGDEF domain-containing protein [Succinivibrio sp.]|nr:GGDEF domain-containing protein [Succinivibrio sp.]